MAENDRKTTKGVRFVCLVAVSAAVTECAKLALAVIPNVEIVTLLCALFGYVFGWAGVVSALVFVCVEPLIWGFGPWFVTYLIHWQAVALIFRFLGKAKIRNRPLLTLCGCLCVVSFGVLDSLIEVGLFTGFYERFFERFLIYYLRGIPFYVTELVTNAFLFAFAFPPLSRFLEKIVTKCK